MSVVKKKGDLFIPVGAIWLNFFHLKIIFLM